MIGVGRLRGHPRRAAAPHFRNRGETKPHRHELTGELEKALAERTAPEWEPLLAAAGVPAARVLTVPEALTHEQIVSRDFVHELPFPGRGDRPLRVLGSPVRVQGATPGPQTPPPLLGEHTDALLAELGYSTDDIAALRKEGTV